MVCCTAKAEVVPHLLAAPVSRMQTNLSLSIVTLVNEMCWG